jgi:hypothetical protein
MLYASGRRLQSMDFEDLERSNRFVGELKHDLGDSLSNCLLCLLSVHASHEEEDIFSKLQVHDPGAVKLVMKEHVELTRRIREVADTCDQIVATSDPAEHLRLGERLGLETTELFSYYMVHLAHEDDWVVPVMWQWFTDDQLNSMRAVFYNNLPMPLFETWMRWTLPALTPSELREFVANARNDPPPNRFQDLLRIAKLVLDPGPWSKLESGLQGASR